MNRVTLPGRRRTQLFGPLPEFAVGRDEDAEEVAVFRYCAGRVARNRYIWLGQDPVSSIAIATVEMG
ncbi:MAG: hypothetical protein M3417_10265 [Actinomycetota bacterium]|nr:hypothetical protein [Actinomycetota bacterium]